MRKQKISGYFVEILKVLKPKTIPEYPELILYVYKNRSYFTYNKRNDMMFLDYDKIWKVFKNNYINNHKKIQKLTKPLIEKYLKLKGITTDIGTFYWKFPK